jgi:RNA polymerase sigma-70 factor (ECF subfamily)
MDQPTEIFEQHRSLLFRLAYGMLGRATAAEDAVQDTFLRWQKQNMKQIQSPKAWLTKVVNRICLDEIKAARNRKEKYVGPDLPEPVFTVRNHSPEEMLELDESLSMALLFLLNKLNPVQRAVFLLHEVFDYDYASISTIVDKSESNCRKILERARNLVREKRSEFHKTGNRQNFLLGRFVEAIRNRNMQEVESLLSEDAIMYTDGGNKMPAARKPVKGAGNIVKLITGGPKELAQPYRIEFKTINGGPGLALWVKEQLHNVWSFHIEDGKIKTIFVVLNQDKLKHVKKSVQ